MAMVSPSRLKLARTRRGMTARALAAAAGISDRTIRAYEAGTASSEASNATLQAIASALTFPVDFFLACDLDIDNRIASFRSLASLTKRDRESAISAGVIASVFADAIDARFLLPPPAIPNFSDEHLGNLPLGRRDSVDTANGTRMALIFAQDAAEKLRNEWQLGRGPIGNMVHLLESKGVRVFRLSDDIAKVDAFCTWNGSVPFVVLNPRKSGERSRFDAAHELGHLILHQDVEGFGQIHEQQANAFASAFLMPADAIRNELPKHPAESALLECKARWRVSLAALIRRGYDIGVYNEYQYRQAYIHLSESGQRRHEKGPVDYEASRVYEAVVRSLKRKGSSLEQMALSLSLPAGDVRGMVLLPDGFEYSLPFPPQRPSGAPAAGATGQIIQFPSKG